MNMGMEVKQAAMGLQAEDPATHAGVYKGIPARPAMCCEAIVYRACGWGAGRVIPGIAIQSLSRISPSSATPDRYSY